MVFTVLLHMFNLTASLAELKADGGQSPQWSEHKAFFIGLVNTYLDEVCHIFSDYGILPIA